MYDLVEHTGDDLQLRIYLLAELKQKTAFFVYPAKTTATPRHTTRTDKHACTRGRAGASACMQADNVPWLPPFLLPPPPRAPRYSPP